ncbi:MAG TPA: hypothetical protein PLO44_00810 [Candidatus Paceibacterota bacterium]|nr:hypothetical protein [Candidatus Paceibacterota bacterium]
MDLEERQLIENTYNLVKENNQMLHKIRRSQRIANFTRFLYWLIIIGITVGAFYFVQPYIDQLQGLMGNTGDALDGFKQFLPK